MNFVISSSDNKRYWYLENEEELEWAREYINVAPDPIENPIFDFFRPIAGEIPKIPIGYLDPSEEEKKKIRTFIDRHAEGQRETV